MGVCACVLEYQCEYVGSCECIETVQKSKFKGPVMKGAGLAQAVVEHRLTYAPFHDSNRELQRLRHPFLNEILTVKTFDLMESCKK